MRLILDRLEGPLAAVELPCGAWWHAPSSLLPKGVKEGDVISLQGNTFLIDAAQTRALRESARARLARLSK